MSRPRVLIAAAAALVTLAMVPRQAAAMHGINFKGQASLSLNVLVPKAQSFGGIELHATAGLQGFGFIAGIGWEVAAFGESGEAHGGYFHTGIELRPLTWSDSDAYELIDLRVGIGGMIGGIETTTFRAALITTLGVDIALTDTDTHPMLSIEYRIAIPGQPDYAPEYLLVLGLGWRFAD